MIEQTLKRGRRCGPFGYMLYATRWLLVAEAVIFLVAATLMFPPRPLLLWNSSASAPVGLYFVAGTAKLQPGDMVAARVPERMRLFAARRGYLPANVPLVKRVAGAAGDTVCASGAAVTVNGKQVARRLREDGRSRKMPWWSGCVDLVEDDFLLIMPNSTASFDGRYFGVSNVDDVVGKVLKL